MLRVLNESDPMDMLVKLYDLRKSCAVFEQLGEQGIHIRRALAAEKHKIAAWVRENFAEGWASEMTCRLLVGLRLAQSSTRRCRL
jgi:hypothetical protein